MTMILTLASKSNLYNIMYSNFVYEGYISNKCVGFLQLAAYQQSWFSVSFSTITSQVRH